jgi:hypothetical protein
VRPPATSASAGWCPSGGAAATAPCPPWSPSRSAPRRAEAVQHAAQLLLLPVRFRRHAGEHDGFAPRATDLGGDGLEGARLVAAHRAHVVGVDAERDRVRLGRRSGRRLGWRQRRAFEPPAAWSRPRGPRPVGRTPPAARGYDGRAARRSAQRRCARTPACSGRA